MPLRRARRAARPGRAARRAIGRFRRMRRKVLKQNVHFFNEKCPLADWSCSANNYNYGTQVYKITDLTNFTAAYKPLFDLYKLLKVKITLFPIYNVSSAEYQNPAGNAGAIPLIAVAPNRDPYVPSPTSWADILNDDGVKVMRLDKPRSFVLSYPKPSIVTDGGNPLFVPLQFNTKMQPWLTTGGNAQILDQSTTPHYGHRWAIWNEGPNNVAIHVVATYYFCFKEQD